jgi:hypothetical protein
VNVFTPSSGGLPRQLCEACGARLFDIREQRGSVLLIVCRRCGHPQEVTI